MDIPLPVCVPSITVPPPPLHYLFFPTDPPKLFLVIAVTHPTNHTNRPHKGNHDNDDNDDNHDNNNNYYNRHNKYAWFARATTTAITRTTRTRTTSGSPRRRAPRRSRGNMFSGEADSSGGMGWFLIVTPTIVLSSTATREWTILHYHPGDDPPIMVVVLVPVPLQQSLLVVVWPFPYLPFETKKILWNTRPPRLVR